jgi:hypothetical protein
VEPEKILLNTTKGGRKHTRMIGAQSAMATPMLLFAAD